MRTDIFSHKFSLDSATALQVIGLLRELANRNCTVICTLHQPRADIFALFDRLLLMDFGKVRLNHVSVFLCACIYALWPLLSDSDIFNTYIGNVLWAVGRCDLSLSAAGPRVPTRSESA